MKRVLMLGGSTSQVYAIKRAKEMGLYVIICDYLSDNPGQHVADEFYLVSTTDKDAVYELAKGLDLDAVICYASDPAAPTAAYVCEKLGLPTSPYKSVMVLSNKDTFRDYLRDNGFCVPRSKSYTDYESVVADADKFSYPVMVKPVDSSGSKGINKVLSKNEIEFAYRDAMKYSRCKRIVVEDFIEKKGYQISGDGFSVDGVLKFRCFGNEYYSDNGIKEYVPLGECWPSVLDKETQNKVHNELQRLITCLRMKTGAYNIEVILDKDDNVYILELGARNGGSLIPQIIQYATGVDMVEYTIKAALGEDCSDIKMVEAKGYWCNYMVHSKVTGRLKEVIIADELKDNFVEYQTDFHEGDDVFAFENAGHALGTMVFKFDSEEEMFDKISRLTDNIVVEII
ncbi:ATP-grasp domain-containing protein [Eubacterium sp.]